MDYRHMWMQMSAEMGKRRVTGLAGDMPRGGSLASLSGDLTYVGSSRVPMKDGIYAEVYLTTDRPASGSPPSDRAPDGTVGNGAYWLIGPRARRLVFLHPMRMIAFLGGDSEDVLNTIKRVPAAQIEKYPIVTSDEELFVAAAGQAPTVSPEEQEQVDSGRGIQHSTRAQTVDTIPTWVIAVGGVAVAGIIGLLVWKKFGGRKRVASGGQSVSGHDDDGDEDESVSETKYKFYVIDKKTHEIIAGNEYKEDAKDAAENSGAGSSVKVVSWKSIPQGKREAWHRENDVMDRFYCGSQKKTSLHGASSQFKIKKKLATSGSLESLKRLIAEFYATKPERIAFIDQGSHWQVQSGEKVVTPIVVQNGKRFVFGT